MLALPLPSFEDYALIDSGNFKKLERFGQFILSRPEPQAIWSPALSEAEWAKKAHATFNRKTGAATTAEDGNWELKPGMPDQWYIRYDFEGMHLNFRLGLTSFKHVGIFPEQAENWNYLFHGLQKMSLDQPLVLNLFAYTGGASLAAKAAGADVVHVDSVKPVVSWARQNMEASQLDNIRWTVEDALKFVRKEAKRGRKYQGIILDPPAYGRGPEGEKWLLEKHLPELMELCGQILDPEHHVLILNLYSMGFSALIAENLAKQYFPFAKDIENGELYIPDQAGRKLPLGVFARFWKA
ncbi:class I SAM-dependent methyltransferase [Haliscomenobacter sp.]|uniref:class I SAM-dependent methyltransferase n=1 Tax=Haliscomenobacter sp. TaxID=2717303 RepID=UPI0033652204